MNTYNRLMAAAAALAVVVTACRGSVPMAQIETGPTKTVDIQVPLPEAAATDVVLTLDFKAGELMLAPGAIDYLATGTATFNVAEFEPKVEVNGAAYIIGAGDREIQGIPSFSGEMKNTWELRLADRPMSLAIEAGAYSGTFDLGGLSLEKLTITEGGSDLTGTFSSPNHAAMSVFTYQAGGSSVSLSGLANANFEQMTFTAGAGEYTLSFDGDLQRDASVTIDTGVGTVTVVVPVGVSAQVTSDGSFSSVTASPGWVQADQVYKLPGSGPSLTITVKMGAGTLNLKTEPDSGL